MVRYVRRNAINGGAVAPGEGRCEGVRTPDYGSG